MSGFTYPEVGATGGRRLPDGYRHLTYRTRLGSAAVLPAAAEAVMTWQMHAAAGMRVTATAPRAAEGVRVGLRIGVGPLTLSAPCQVVWTVEREGEVGFAYGTLSGHPAAGEEAFVVSRDEGGSVWLTVTSFSRPARWHMRLAGPVAPLLQRLAARRYARALRRLTR